MLGGTIDGDGGKPVLSGPGSLRNLTGFELIVCEITEFRTFQAAAGAGEARSSRLLISSSSERLAQNIKNTIGSDKIPMRTVQFTNTH